MADATPPELPPGLLEEYLENARSQLSALAKLAERLAASGDDREALDQLRRETHKIHGSAGSYGFMEASRLAAGMEATLKDWVARPADAEVDRGSLARWFVGRLAEMLGVQVPRAATAAAGSAAPPRSAPLPRVGPPPRPSHGSPTPKPVPQPPRPAPRGAPPPARAPAPPPAPAPGPALTPRRPPTAKPVSAPPQARPPGPPPQPRPPAPPGPRPPASGELPWVVPPAAPSHTPRAASPPPPAVPASAPAPAATTPAAGRAPPAHAARPGAATKVPEVIYVEDDASLAELLEYGLRAHGYRFAAYRNGREALRELLALDVQGTHPLLLLDVDLPALDGYSIFAALERERPGIYRVVFTTVHGTEEEQLRGLEAGALDYLVKPISLRVALEKIKRWVGR